MPSKSLPKQLAFSIIALCALASCGPPSREQARDMATTRSCDWYASCGEIGSGKRYETRDACEVDVRSSWNNLWPTADCNGKIDGDALDVCLKAIDITDCANGFDFFNTVFNKCGKDKVCPG
jgi:hypothetical protein